MNQKLKKWKRNSENPKRKCENLKSEMKRRKTEMKMKKRSCFLFSMEEDVVNLKKSVSLHTRVKERCDVNGVGCQGRVAVLPFILF